MGKEVGVRQNLGGGALAEFEEIYRSNVGVVAAYFARRCREPQEVADLTSETIVRAAGSFDSFEGHPARSHPSEAALTGTPTASGTRATENGAPVRCLTSVLGPIAASWVSRWTQAQAASQARPISRR